MKKNALKITLAGLLLAGSSLCASAGDMLTKKQLNDIENSYPKFLKAPGVKVTKGMDRGKFKQIGVEIPTRGGVQKFNVFVDDNVKNTIFIGKAYTKDGKSYDLPLNSKLIKQGVAFTMGNGKEDIYLVIDPECPWCQKLEKDMSKEAYNKYKINIIPLPLRMHRNSRNVMYWILSAKTNAEKAKRFYDYTHGKNQSAWRKFKPTDKQVKKYEKILKDSNAAASELQAKGTPSIYTKDFKQMPFQALVKKPTTK